MDGAYRSARRRTPQAGVSDADISTGAPYVRSWTGGASGTVGLIDDIAHDPETAAPPRTKGPTRTYEADRIAVVWDATRCIHTALCLRALPGVFNVRARPWVDVHAASADDIAAAVRLCPTGALRYEARGDLPAEAPDDPTTVDVRPNGPLFVRGRVQVTDPRSGVIAEEYRVALCRCGASANKPFCDNSHRLIRFRDDRTAAEPPPAP